MKLGRVRRGLDDESASDIANLVEAVLDGRPYTTSGIRSAWLRACARTGVKNASIKDLRPKSLSDAERAGYRIEELKTAAAHGSVTTTELYLKIYRESVSRVELKLPRRLKKG